MPRPQREQLILDVAGLVFARDGYHAASMDEIAELADVSKPMLYTYFGSKEGLYLAYIDRTGKELLARLIAAAPAIGGHMERLRARIAEFLAFVEEHRDGWTVLFRERTSNGPIAEKVAELRDRLAEGVRQMLENDPSASPGLSPLASRGIAQAIVGAGEALANWWLEHPEVEREEVADWYVGLVRAAVAAAIRSRRAS